MIRDAREPGNRAGSKRDGGRRCGGGAGQAAAAALRAGRRAAGRPSSRAGRSGSGAGRSRTRSARGPRRGSPPASAASRHSVTTEDTAAMTSTRLRIATTATGPGSRSTILQYRSGNSTCVSATAASASSPVTRRPRPSPTTTRASRGRVQTRNCGESTLLQTVNTSTQASAARGTCCGAERSSSRSPPDEDVDDGHEDHADPRRDLRDRLAAGGRPAIWSRTTCRCRRPPRPSRRRGDRACRAHSRSAAGVPHDR